MRTLADRRQEQAKANSDDRDLESRTDRRRQQDARETMLKGVATRLVNSKPAALERLELDDELRSAIGTAQAIRSAAARNRQTNVVRQHLRAMGLGIDALVKRLDAPTRGSPLQPAPIAVPRGPAPSPAVSGWCERLAEAGDSALEQLVSVHPSVDRQQLRQRTRELVRARAEGHPPVVARAEARLRALLEPLGLIE